MKKKITEIKISLDSLTQKSQIRFMSCNLKAALVSVSVDGARPVYSGCCGFYEAAAVARSIADAAGYTQDAIRRLEYQLTQLWLFAKLEL